MNIKIKLEINFHKPDEVSITIDNTAKGREEKYSEILLFCCFTLRTLSNLGNHPSAKDLATFLSNFNKDKQLEDQGANEPKLIDYQGCQGSKSFMIEIKLSEEYYNFTYEPKGFGILNSGVELYASMATILLTTYFLKENRDDEEFMKAFESSANMCGSLYFNGEITFSNQRQLALLVSEENYKISKGK